MFFRMSDLTDDLTDAQIRSICGKNGIKVGPLTSSTRKIYLKKLEKIQSSADKKTENGNNVATILEKGFIFVFFNPYP